MNDQKGANIQLTGIVQGVGFRPFVYGLAKQLDLTGSIRNTSAGVDIEIAGDAEKIKFFLDSLTKRAPPLAVIQDIKTIETKPNGASQFIILPSATIRGECLPLSADVAVCDDCLSELFNSSDRRYRYPFINCTNCGPRYSIISDLPYDRPYTSMRQFPMCPECSKEYQDPLDRRFHAQPIACPHCGPQVWIEMEGIHFAEREEAINLARQMLANGQILAIQGLGGFHLACDATNTSAVLELRARKQRPGKPLALMMPDLQTVQKYCDLKDPEHDLISSRQKPILILDRKIGADGKEISPEIAPGQTTLGVMLPYTPLHYLILEPEDEFPSALVMTSGNHSDEPILVHELEAKNRLGEVADAFLLHNREILHRCDDSVGRVMSGKPLLIRRARGFAPTPITMPFKSPPILGLGAGLKNTFCLSRENQAFLSPHIGDLENHETLMAFEQTISEFERLFRTQPNYLACDRHPDYLSSKYGRNRAQAESMELITVQHHHAHAAACMVDNQIDTNERVIAVAFDGTGLGTDGAIWGGEFLLANYSEFKRLHHLKYMPLPGGDQAVRQVWRMGYIWLKASGFEEWQILPPMIESEAGVRQLIDKMVNTGLNCPSTSSMGRLFDAAASILGICHHANYEAQAAIELEAVADPAETGSYPLDIQDDSIDPSPMIRALAQDYLNKLPIPQIAARFHNGITQMVVRVCKTIRGETGLNKVALSGGVWQNRFLFERTVLSLKQEGFTVLVHKQIPTNDGGIAIGQAAITQYWINQNV